MTIKEKFAQLKEQGKKAFIAYVPFGFPTIAHTKDIILTLQDAGVDVIEVGVPFSDPIADGPIIQEATAIALQRGANVEKLFSLLVRLRKDLRIPLVIMTYYNPVSRFGIDRFFSKMRAGGASGIITVDLPHDENKAYLSRAHKYNLETIFLITPATSLRRAQAIAKHTRGFIYYVSVTGITGPKNLDFASLKNHIKDLRAFTDLPILVGFGIHSRAQVKKIESFCDGVIVGSSIVKFIKDGCLKKNFLSGLKKYVHSLGARGL